MKKIRGFKKAGSVAGILLAAALTFGTVPKAAHATYLGSETISLTNTAGSTPFSVDTAAYGTVTMYYSTTSSYGATIPTPAQINATLNAAGFASTTINSIGTISGDNYVPVTFYDPSSGQSFTLNQINTITDPFTAGGTNGASISGNVLSNVFQVVGGSHNGDLVFSYQFNVTSVSISGTYLDSGSVAFFNEPLNGLTGIGTPWVLGDGINATATNTGVINPLNGLPVYNFASDAIGSTLTGAVQFSATGASTVTFDSVTNGNNSVESINYLGAQIGAGDVSPQFFVASNATTYTIGSFTFGGVGAGFPGDPVFVPGTPEPGTLVLFGTALGLVAFMVVRNRRSQSIA